MRLLSASPSISAARHPGGGSTIHRSPVPVSRPALDDRRAVA
ncbi:hypothetical protein SLI_6103 [Streptomyces lividans 1326]|uniref:Uncharacterized protein n=1 Tax=Streptomyces lividans 1326 TaxID=1200984 RepID=A0A7U9DYL3_STRLI|nr:hypothetical protein SLI_6103 [Streptomyces lividans 1326]